MKKKRIAQNRNLQFAEKTKTKIWQEKAVSDNPYIAETCYCHGYNLQELMQKCSYAEVLYLLFRGNLPTKDQAELFQQLMVALINPGPRHPASRAAMAAGIGKTDLTHVLPISLSIMGGTHLGAGSIGTEVRFFRKNKKQAPQIFIKENISLSNKPHEGDWHPIPGFGSYYGGIDILSRNIAHQLLDLPAAGKALTWGNQIAAHLESFGFGWLKTGVAAAVFCDLGFTPQASIGLFQILTSPGLYAHGEEAAKQPITNMPFTKDENYIIEE